MKEKIDIILKKVLNRTFIMYVIFGVVTSLENIALYAALIYTGMDYKIANVITLLVVKLSCYVVNKLFVFQTKCGSFSALVKEFIRFVVTRGITMVIDLVGVIVLVELLAVDELISKAVLMVIVVILNYFFGKKHVFVKTKTTV